MSAAFEPLIVDPFDRNLFEQEVAAALKAPDSRIFLDTNILTWMYSLHRAARAEFCQWLTDGPIKGRIHIPRRVLHEFAAHRADDAKLYPFGQEFSWVIKTLERFEQAAPLVVDDKLAKNRGFSDRGSYMDSVTEARELVTRLVQAVASSNEKIKDIHAQLVPVFNKLALSTDIFTGLSDLRQSYEARAELRIQPGFQDAKKGRNREEENTRQGAPAKSGANRFGDFAIWEEILAFVKAEAAADKPGAVFILTHDNKTDWSYYPKYIVDSDGHTKPNPTEGTARVGIAQPLLAHELKLRTKAPALYILTIHRLAAIANTCDSGFKFGELARAVQVQAAEEAAEKGAEIEATNLKAEEESPPTEPNAGTVDPADRVSQTEPVTTEQQNVGVATDDSDVSAFLAEPPATALADANYTRDDKGPPAFDDVINALQSHNWYVQNPGVRTGLAMLQAGQATLLQSFVFGRNLYQAAVGTAVEATRALENLATRMSQVDADRAGAVYAGALFELYFDRDGQIRHRPKSSQIDALLRHQQIGFFAPALAFIQAQLVAAGAHLLVAPSAEKPTRHLAVEVDTDNRITAIKLGEVVLTKAWQEGSGGDPLPPHVSHHLLMVLVATNFSAPITQLELTPFFEGSREVADLQFIAWNSVAGPDLS